MSRVDQKLLLLLLSISVVLSTSRLGHSARWSDELHATRDFGTAGSSLDFLENRATANSATLTSSTGPVVKTVRR
jgi:hypothetical protein